VLQSLVRSGAAECPGRHTTDSLTAFDRFSVDIRLAHAAVQWADNKEEQQALRRSLEILEVVTSGSRIGIALVRLGLEERAADRVIEMAASADPLIRRSAAWAMGQVPNAHLSDVLNGLRTDSNERVRRHALKSLCTLGKAGVKLNQVLAPFPEFAAGLADKPF
jgi:HEAT repeat protein